MVALNKIYHVYNRGNDRRIIFPEDKNYPFFRAKIQKRFSGIAEILAYCLMPNHFHLLLTPTQQGVQLSKSARPAVDLVEADNTRMLQNFSVAIQGLLSGYARSHNKLYGRTGSLFSQKTKVDEVGLFDPQTMRLLDGTRVVNCFNYIHQNPVKANLVDSPGEWSFSSYLEYAGFLQGEEVCNIALGKTLLNPN